MTSTTRKLLSSSAIALGVAVTLGGTAGGAHAAQPASESAAGVTVTIKAENTDLSGVVKSSKVACKADRTVIVYKQKGARGGGDDKRFAMDTTFQQGSRYTWSTGNTGTEGRFYAKVAASPGCKVAFSPTIRATRSD